MLKIVVVSKIIVKFFLDFACRKLIWVSKNKEGSSNSAKNFVLGTDQWVLRSESFFEKISSYLKVFSRQNLEKNKIKKNEKREKGKFCKRFQGLSFLQSRGVEKKIVSVSIWIHSVFRGLMMLILCFIYKFYYTTNQRDSFRRRIHFRL